MLDFLIQIKSAIAVAIIAPVVGLFGGGHQLPPQPIPAPITQEDVRQIVKSEIFDQSLGGTNQIPDTVALFSTSLASKITPTATSMTLSAATYNKGASTLASSTYAFIIDEGSSIEEMVIADCTATVCTNMVRGLDRLTGTTSVTSLAFAHDRGASVKITDGPVLLIHNRLLQGIDRFGNVIRYDSSVTTANLGLDGQNLASVAYANSLAFGAIPAASESASGFVELSTDLEAASSTSSGSAARLVLPASIATSTYNAATAGLKVVVTQNNGKIDSNFLQFAPFTGDVTIVGTTTLASTTIIGSTHALDIGKNVAVITTLGTTTWPIPSGVKKVSVHVVGGGAGAGENIAASGAGYAFKIFDVSATTSLAVYVGAGGVGNSSTGNVGNPSVVYDGTLYVVANGGQVSIYHANGGTATGGDLNLQGGSGSFVPYDASEGISGTAIGGGTHFGSTRVTTCDSATCSGDTGNSYGGGGTAGDGTGEGGAGAQGVVIISY